MARLLRTRSILAGVVAAFLAVSALALTVAGAATRPDLPPIAPGRLIASSIAASAHRSLSMSGTVETHTDLGIPQLPGSVSAGTSGPLALLTSDQTFRTWRSPDGVRVEQLLPNAERDVVVTPTDAWLWDSTRFAAWHARLPGASAIPRPPTPADLSSLVTRLLARLRPYATVSEAPQAEVAGRAAYVLTLRPTSDTTLVDRVDVAVDGETRVPVRLEIFARGESAPVMSVGYTQVSFAPVDASMFSFTPPAGATVHRIERPGSPSDRTADAAMSQLRWFGTGFDLVAAVPVASVPRQLASLLPYRGPLGSADVVERNGRTWLVAGLVPGDVLARAEAKL